MRYQYIFFDLDGTLTDPREGITKSVQYALRHMGIEEPDLAKLEPFIGPPLLDSFQEYYDFSLEQARAAVEYYREYFSGTGVYQNVLLEGVPELLQSLKAHGRTVAVASSKPEHFVRLILAHFHTMTRSRGSVPLGRTIMRPSPPRVSLTLSMAPRTRWSV